MLFLFESDQGVLRISASAGDAHTDRVRFSHSRHYTQKEIKPLCAGDHAVVIQIERKDAKLRKTLL